MPSTLAALAIARTGALRTALVAARALLVAGAYYFYGYWFSQRRA
ncbi:MAG: hypothetical protein GAK43_00837 [Stenotrophomonas maltophilia]|nr:MAG: hypothetical protein GAK43_00837 [Stenotrophomonas maltophilia]